MSLGEGNDDDRSNSMQLGWTNWLSQRPLSASCGVQAASAYLQQHLLAGRGLVVGAGAWEAGEEVFLFHGSNRMDWGGLGEAWLG